MKAAEQRIVSSIKHLLDLHDQAEMGLVKATRQRRSAKVLEAMWAEHDVLERAIIQAAARLPQRTVTRLQRGEL